MKQAILITAYTNLEHLNNIIRSLNNPQFFIFIHIDKKTPDKKEWLKLLLENKNVKKVTSSYKIHWGGVNHLKAILHLLKESFQYEEIEYFHLITGHDYPIKKPEILTDYLRENKGKDFIEANSIPYKNWKNGGMERILYYNFYDIINGRKGWRKVFIRIAVNIQKIFKINRKFPKSFPEHLYGGSTYWSLSRKSIQYILEYISKYPSYLERFNFTFCSEEIFFQTLLMNSPYREDIINNNLRFIVWEERNGNFPANLDETDYTSIYNSEAFFARKFEPGISDKLIEKIDAEILSKHT